ncbi:hypothetical protein M432DRAFT_213843 [Thermoascus aurantiacus ATCC 26904]
MRQTSVWWVHIKTMKRFVDLGKEVSECPGHTSQTFLIFFLRGMHGHTVVRAICMAATMAAMLCLPARYVPLRHFVVSVFYQIGSQYLPMMYRPLLRGWFSISIFLFLLRERRNREREGER